MNTLSVSDAAERLGMTPSKVHLLVRRGDLVLTPTAAGMFQITTDSIDRYKLSTHRRQRRSASA